MENIEQNKKIYFLKNQRLTKFLNNTFYTIQKGLFPQIVHKNKTKITLDKKQREWYITG